MLYFLQFRSHTQTKYNLYMPWSDAKFSAGGVATCKHCILLIRSSAGHNITLSRSSGPRVGIFVILESALDPDGAL